MLARLCSRARGASLDAGATLVEVMVVVAMIGTLTAFTVWGIRGWATSSAHKGTAQQVQSVLRTTQQRAITEGMSFCVAFDTDKYAVFRSECTEPMNQTRKVSGWFGSGSSDVTLAWTPTVATSNTARNRGVTFSPRGSAWPGKVSVVRAGSSPKSYVVQVEGMTGHVSLG